MIQHTNLKARHKQYCVKEYKFDSVNNTGLYQNKPDTQIGYKCQKRSKEKETRHIRYMVCYQNEQDTQNKADSHRTSPMSEQTGHSEHIAIIRTNRAQTAYSLLEEQI